MQNHQLLTVRQTKHLNCFRLRIKQSLFQTNRQSQNGGDNKSTGRCHYDAHCAVENREAINKKFGISYLAIERHAVFVPILSSIVEKVAPRGPFLPLPARATKLFY